MTHLKRLKQTMCVGLIFGVLLAGGSVACATDIDTAEIDIASLIQELQRMSPKHDELGMVFWMPEEFWRVSFAQDPAVTSAEADEFHAVMKPYILLAVVDGTIGTFGAVTYKSGEWVRANTRVVDAQGNTYTPLADHAIDGSAHIFLQMMKPAIAHMLGPLGENLHFLLFPAQAETGERIAPALNTGEFSVILGDMTYRWRLPLDALLPTTACTGCGETCKGSWHFCPWCGTPVAQGQ